MERKRKPYWLVNKVRIFSFIIFFLLVFRVSYGQDTYNKTQSELIFNRLPHKCKQDFEASDTINCKIKGHDFTIYKTKFIDGYVSYGLHIFPDWKIVQSDEVLNFIEREMLFYLLSNTNTRNERNKVKHVYFSTNRNNRVSSNLIYSISNTFQGYRIENVGLSYEVTLSGKSGDKIIIDFPAEYAIISGRDKVGLQQLLFIELTTTKDSTITFYKHDADLLIKSGDIFMNKGDIFLIGDMNTNIYYQQDKNGIVFDKSHSEESFSNLFMTDISLKNNIIVNLTMKNYNSKDKLQIELSKLISYFDNGFVKYFGIEEVSDDTIRGSLLLYNKSYSYMHLLDAEVKIDELFDENARIDIKMYSYIPTHNIKDLFGISK